MNAEQLHAVCKELVNEISEHQLIDRLTNLEQALEQAASQPHVQEFQQQIGEIRSQLKLSLSSEKKDWAVSQKQIIDEIGGTSLLGKSLLDRVERSFTQNEVTLVLVKDDISNIRNELIEFHGGLQSLIDGFVKFNIAFEQLEPYAAELGIIIPRANNENLAFIAKDLKKLEYELQAFSELVTGQTEQFRVKTISSSDYSIFLGLSPVVVLVVVKVIVELEEAYIKFLEIRLRRKEFKEKNAPQPVMEEIDKWIIKSMEDEVDKITKELLVEHEKINRPDGRENELEMRVKTTVRKFAGRIDAGYNFSARIGPLDTENEEDTNEEYLRKEKIVESIAEASKTMELRKFSGDSVLPLEWQPERENNNNGEPEV